MFLINRSTILTVFIISVSCIAEVSVAQSKIDNFSFRGSFDVKENFVRGKFHFNGYTRYQPGNHDIWTRYGNLFKMVTPDIMYSVTQSKLEAAKDLGLPGLSMQEGFFKGLFGHPFVIMDQPSTDRLDEYLKYYKDNNILVMVDPDSEIGKVLIRNLIKNADNSLNEMLGSEQKSYNGNDVVNAFVLENDTRKVFVISSTSEEYRNKLRDLVINTEILLKEYDMKRGWFGVRTGLKTDDISTDHALEIINRGLGEGNSWFVFDGNMFLVKNELEKRLAELALPIITEMGYSPVYGLENYDSLRTPGMFTPDSWIRYAHDNGGYVFGDVYDNRSDSLHLAYDGLFASEENKGRIDNGNLPFVSRTGDLESGFGPFMILFVKKGELFTKKQLWEAILQRREVSVLDQGRMLGPSDYRNALEILFLDRVFIEEYFGDRINIDVSARGYEVEITLSNDYPYPVSGQINIEHSSQLKFRNDMKSIVNMPPHSSKSILYEIQSGADSMNKISPIAVHYKWDGGIKSTLTILNLSPMISACH